MHRGEKPDTTILRRLDGVAVFLVRELVSNDDRGGLVLDGGDKCIRLTFSGDDVPPACALDGAMGGVRYTAQLAILVNNHDNALVTRGRDSGKVA